MRIISYEDGVLKSEIIKGDMVIFEDYQGNEVFLNTHKPEGFLMYDTGSGCGQKDLTMDEVLNFACELSEKAQKCLRWI